MRRSGRAGIPGVSGAGPRRRASPSLDGAGCPGPHPPWIARTASIVSASSGRLVRPVAQHPGEPQRHPARVAAATSARRRRRSRRPARAAPARPSRRVSTASSCSRSVCQASISSVRPLNVLPSMTKPPRRVAGTEVQVRQPAAAAAVPPLGGQHDEVERVPRLHLEPARPAPAGLVGRVERLHHHALVAAARRASSRNARRLGQIGGHHGGAPAAPRAPRRQRRRTGRRRGRSSRSSPSSVQHVEDVRRQRRRSPVPPRRRPASETRLPVCWNGRGRPSGAQRDRLAVEHDVAHRQRQRGLDDLGHPLGDVVEAAGEDARRRRRRGAPGPGRRRASTRRRPRPAGPARRRRRRRWRRASAAPAGRPAAGTPASAGGPVGERGLGHRRRRAAQHRRPAHVGQRHLGRLGDSVDHHALERALAQLAAEQAAQQALLGLGRPAEQVADQARAARAWRPRRRRARRRSSSAASTSPTVSVGRSARRRRGRAARPSRRRSAAGAARRRGRPTTDRHLVRVGGAAAAAATAATFSVRRWCRDTASEAAARSASSTATSCPQAPTSVRSLPQVGECVLAPRGGTSGRRRPSCAASTTGTRACTARVSIESTSPPHGPTRGGADQDARGRRRLDQLDEAGVARAVDPAAGRARHLRDAGAHREPRAPAPPARSARPSRPRGR